MTNKNLITLVGAAVILGACAYFVNDGATAKVPRLNGKMVLPGLDVSKVAAVEFGQKLKLASSADGWTVASYHGYPADRGKLTENLLKLAELKVGQVARGKKLAKTDDLVLRDAGGKELVRLPLGEKHSKWGHGRYATFEGETVLVSDALESFDGEGKTFVETKIVDEPWVSFEDIVEGVAEAELGFATGVVAKVTIAGDTNRTVTVGNAAKDGSRYLKLDRGNWIFKVPSYSVDKLLPKPPPKEEPKDEPKKDEPKDGSAK